MELMKVIAKSNETPVTMVPGHVLKSLALKMKNYELSVAGKDPWPIPTRDNEQAKKIRPLWRDAQKKWNPIAKSLESKDGVALSRVKTLLELPAFKQFEDLWHAFPHGEAPDFARSDDELKLVEDFETEEAERQKKATDAEEAKKDVEELKKQANVDYERLVKAARPELRNEHDLIAKDIRKHLPKDKSSEDWIEGRKAWEQMVKVLDKMRDEETFGQQRQENRDHFGERLDKLVKAIGQLAAGKTLDKQKLEERKSALLERHAKLDKVYQQNNREPTWEPEKDHLKELVALWSEVYKIRGETGETTPPEPGIKVVHSPEITKDKNRWKAWADKVDEIDNAFTTGLLAFSKDMKLTGNPGCRFHKQGRFWKFYLDEAEMGGSTTLRGLYLPTNEEGGGITVTFKAITDSHGGPSERELYGSTK